MKPSFRCVLLGLSFLVLAPCLQARIVSYAPYTDRPAIPAVQHRLNRHFALLELGPGGDITGQGVFLPYYGQSTGQVVLYDSWGLEEPRVIFPADRTVATVGVVAVREDENHVPTILVQSVIPGMISPPLLNFYLSTDAGMTWKTVKMPPTQSFLYPSYAADTGGPIARGRYSQVRIGTSETPFVVVPNYYGGATYAIQADGTSRELVPASTAVFYQALVGSNREGTEFLMREGQNSLVIVDLDGNKTTAGTIENNVYNVEGWITPARAVYVETQTWRGPVLSMYDNGERVVIASATPQSDPRPYVSVDPMSLFAIPTHDYSGAWFVERRSTSTDLSTDLSLHTPEKGTIKQWQDRERPLVEALHAGASGQTLLIQVHRPRPQVDQRLVLLKDPALAVWRIGEPAPAAYDELFMNEQPTKGFVHVDVDKLLAGEPFVFDSGFFQGGGVIISPAVPTPGGGDVIQEWGVVRASLRQKLILPGIGRLPGAFGSFWRSDLVISNPVAGAQNVTMVWVPNGDGLQASASHQKTLTLGPREIRHIPDVLETIFGIGLGNGALIITPDEGVSATSRTYTEASKGSYGYALGAIDALAGAASPRFTVSFSGAFPGAKFRTNLILADTSGRGTNGVLAAPGSSGSISEARLLRVPVPANGQEQIHAIAPTLGLAADEQSALVVQPETGSAIAGVIVLDNVTNDPTYFPPDTPAPVVRTIPGIVHVDGANNSKFRSDLYLFNPSPLKQSVVLQVSTWDSSPNPPNQTLTLLPFETRVVPDVLFTLFERTGIARLRYSSFHGRLGVRVTSRVYTVQDDGGTYGSIMPPLNSFQSAGKDESLEILGAVADARFRTNLGLVDLAGFKGPFDSSARIDIIDRSGNTIDSFVQHIPSAGGLQLNDVFRVRGIATDVGPVIIRVSTTLGMVGAYASMVDNGTNDSSYLGANLAARP